MTIDDMIDFAAEIGFSAMTSFMTQWYLSEIVYDANGKTRKFDGYVWPIPQAQRDVCSDVLHTYVGMCYYRM